ncbi:hypothetical protein D3C81_748200 [compost metagenome]
MTEHRDRRRQDDLAQRRIGLLDDGPCIERVRSIIAQHDRPQIARQRLLHRTRRAALNHRGQVLQGVRACDGTHGSWIIVICKDDGRSEHPKRKEREGQVITE